MLAVGLTFSAQAILVTPTSSSLVLFGNDSSQSAIETLIQANFGPLTVLYKQNQSPFTEEGSFAANYSTTFNNSDLTDSDARISYVSGTPINSDPVYALIKDGNATPNWYLFDISGWNGTDNVDFASFFNGQKNVSHVSLYGNQVGVPDGGTTIALLGFALVGIGALRNKFSKN